MDRILKKGSRTKKMDMNWVEGYKIRIRVDNGEAVISANREGLLSLAKHMVGLSEEKQVSHIHYDEYNSLEEGSINLIIERIE